MVVRFSVELVLVPRTERKARYWFLSVPISVFGTDICSRYQSFVSSDVVCAMLCWFLTPFGLQIMCFQIVYLGLLICIFNFSTFFSVLSARYGSWISEFLHIFIFNTKKKQTLPNSIISVFI